MNAAARSHHLHLTPRDVQILLMVYRYDGCVSAQIRRRFWPGLGARSPYYQRLSRLINAGFLRAVRLPSISASGSGPSWLTLGPRAHAVLRGELHLVPDDLKRLRHSYVPMFWRHDAACRDFRLALELACERSSHARVVEWHGDRDLKRKPLTTDLTFPWGEHGTFPLALVPDAVFTLERPEGDSKRFFLEIDRGTEVWPLRFKRKLKHYIDHLGQMGGPVLFVVPDEPRRAQIVRWIEQEAKTCSKSFATARADQVTEESILHSPIWQVVGERPQPLVPEGRPGTRRTGISPISGEGEPWRS